MKLRTYSLIAAAILTLPCTSSLAATEYFYFGAGVGQTDNRKACNEFDDLGFSSNCDDSDTAVKLFAGYRYSPNLALEGFYVDFGETSAKSGNTRLTVEPETFGVSAVGLWPASREIDLFAKLGVTFWNMKGDSQLDGEKISVSDDDVDFTFGAGAQYLFSSQFALRLEWERYNKIGNADTFQSDIDLISVSAAFAFY